MFRRGKGLRGWLPVRHSNRTKSLKSVAEITPYYSRAYSKGCLFVRGQKPRELARIAKISARRWHQYQNDSKRENPIHTALRFLQVFNQESVSTYADAARILGVSRQRVCQYVSLDTKLPDEIKDFLSSNSDPNILRHFTERRLRRLTLLRDEQTKLAEFQRMLAECRPPERREGCWWLVLCPNTTTLDSAPAVGNANCKPRPDSGFCIGAGAGPTTSLPAGECRK